MSLRLDVWQNCWAHRAGPPTFKARLRSRMCVDVPQGRDLNIARITRTWGMVRVPKVGVVRFRWTMDLPVGKHADAANRITGARLAREANGWHVVLRVLTQVKEPVPHTGPGVGIDRGVAKPLALSDDTFREHGPWLSKGEQERLRRLERKAARQRRHRKAGEVTSNRLCRTYDQIAGVRAKAKRRALDWQHRVTHGLAEEFGVVEVEDLNITGMVRSARGTVDSPGTHVAQKSGLNRAIAGEAWGRTVTLLEYKLADRGGHLVGRPPRTPLGAARGATSSPRAAGSPGTSSCARHPVADTSRTPTPTPRTTWSIRPSRKRPRTLWVPGRGALAVRRALKRRPPAADTFR
ncbi:hypothetical protein HNR06_005290 [Nocardiopsis arvandica]|uniref:Probable transposase IS891/IS1136/IS1341 domain-containing protein n=1 Tax=Nocardiopsis sinuspersici TaxID=501010 RepID=A0A7Y9XH51_9ACTN|nr:hypothetical protein [Nocardiopsis sinuspersici]